MDTLTNLPTGSGWDNFWMVVTILVAIYEIVIRYIPTVKDYTILGVLYKILDWLVENRAKMNEDEIKDIKKSGSSVKQKKRFTIKGVIDKVFN